jgi:hypothetical protein
MNKKTYDFLIAVCPTMAVVMIITSSNNTTKAEEAPCTINQIGMLGWIGQSFKYTAPFMELF